MKSYKLIVFDWDGTLMDSREQIVSCMRQALSECNLPVQPDDELQQVIGLGLQEAVRQLLPRQTAKGVEKVVDAYRHHWLSSPPGLSHFFESIEAMLHRLSGEGYKLAIATGKSRRGLDKQLDETGTRHLFDVSRCADESRSKPAPDMLLEIMDTLECAAQDTLLIGDTTFDMQMAQSADVDRLAVSYGVHSKQQLDVYQPLAILSSSHELVEWFDINILPSQTKLA